MKPAVLLRTFLWWFVAASLVILLGVPGYFLSLLDRKRRALSFMTYLWSWMLMKLAGCTLKVFEGENLERYSQFILVSNHQSYFDIFTIICLLRRVPHFLAKKELFTIPLFGQLLRMACMLEIDREHPDVALESIKQGISKGVERPIAIFPEGTRSLDGELQPFRKKGLNLLMETGLPLIPVAIKGTRDAMPKKSYWVTPARIRVKIGEPFIPGLGLSEEEREEVREMIWQWIKQELERL